MAIYASLLSRQHTYSSTEAFFQSMYTTAALVNKRKKETLTVPIRIDNSHFGGKLASKVFFLKQPLTKWVTPILPVADKHNPIAQKSSPRCDQMLELSLNIGKHFMSIDNMLNRFFKNLRCSCSITSHSAMTRQLG